MKSIRSDTDDSKISFEKEEKENEEKKNQEKKNANRVTVGLG
jgi:hypothetical protein